MPAGWAGRRGSKRAQPDQDPGPAATENPEANSTFMTSSQKAALMQESEHLQRLAVYDHSRISRACKECATPFKASAS